MGHNKMMMKAALMLAVMVAGANAMETSGASEFEEAIAGKSAFVKFLAPWGGHCKSMKPAWDKLAKEYEGNSNTVVVDVDCTDDGNRDVCSKYGVQGYPTIKYFTSATDALGDDYEGGRSFDDLKKFAEENLGPQCGPDNMDLCSEEQSAEIKKFMEMGEEALEALLKEKDAAIAAAQPGLRVIRSVMAVVKKSDDGKD